MIIGVALRGKRQNAEVGNLRCIPHLTLSIHYALPVLEEKSFSFDGLGSAANCFLLWDHTDVDLKLTYTALTSPFLFSKMTIGTFILKEYVELLKIKGTDNH